MKKETLTKLWQYLLSLQKGFAYSGQKKRIVFENGEFCYLDLEFFHLEIRSLVIINLRSGRPKPQQLMQMQRLVDYYNKREKYSHENPTIGIVINKTKTACYVSYVGVTAEQEQIAERSLALKDF